MRWIITLLTLLLLLTACDSTSGEPTVANVAIIKELATVEIPPTPNPAQRQQTRQALPRTPTLAPPSATPTATAYVGVFIGTPNDGDGGAPIRTAVVNPTAALPDIAAVGCTVVVDPVFGTDWQTNPSIVRQIGCPIQERFGFAGSVQVYERGVMYRRVETNEVWAVRIGTVSGGEFWNFSGDSLPPEVPLLPGESTPPTGLSVPDGVFGSVWSGDTRVRSALGFATTPEQTADLNIQRYDGGTLFLDVTVGQVFVLLVNGDAFGPFQF